MSAGLYNPVILKRFTPVWRAESQLELLKSFFSNLEARFDQQFMFEKPILRRFLSVEEQNNWFVASDKPSLKQYMSTVLRYEKFFGISSPFDFGEVKESGYVDVAFFVQCYRNFLSGRDLLSVEDFEYSLLVVKDDSINYKNLEARNIVFAEGFGMHRNPFFSSLPLIGSKGELLVIKAPDLDLNVIVNTSIFILPLGQQLFKVGSTYNFIDKSDQPTEDGKNELIKQLKSVLRCDFEVVSHIAGVRPTVKDRRPLVGTHQEFRNIHVLNGLGTRGVMNGPSMALALFNHIEIKEPLLPEIDIKRFEKI